MNTKVLVAILISGVATIALARQPAREDLFPLGRGVVKISSSHIGDQGPFLGHVIRLEFRFYRSSEGLSRQDMLGYIDDQLFDQKTYIAIPADKVTYHIDFKRGRFCRKELLLDELEVTPEFSYPPEAIVEYSEAEPDPSVFELPEGLVEVDCQTLKEEQQN